MEKKCPFGNCQCTSECALFIAPDDLNELVVARLSSIGVLDRKKWYLFPQKHRLSWW